MGCNVGVEVVVIIFVDGLIHMIVEFMVYQYCKTNKQCSSCVLCRCINLCMSYMF